MGRFLRRGRLANRSNIMKRSAIFLLALLLVMCGIITVNASPPQQSNDVRPCLFIPGVTVPAQIPPELLDNPMSTPTTEFPSATQVDSDITAQQLEVFSGLWNAVNDHYVYSDFR